MTLTIEDEDRKCSALFKQFILKQIKYQIYKRIHSEQLNYWDNYFNSTQIIPHNIEDIISTKDILIQASRNFVCDEYDNKLIFHINNNMYVRGYDAKLIDVVKLINFGNMEQKPYLIINESLNSIADNMPVYIHKYRLLQTIKQKKE